MACEEPANSEKRVNQFAKIKLLENFANQIGWYGVQCGNVELMDKLDLNCGAIPEGTYEQIIDFSAPHQFLSLYMGIAENRFAYAVTELLRMNQNNLSSLCQSLYQAGKDMNLQQINSIEKAFEVVEAYILDGMPCDETKKIVEKSENQIVWEKTVDTHEAAWKKVEGDLSVYYALQESFVNGLIESSGYSFTVKNNSTFTIKKVTL